MDSEKKIDEYYSNALEVLEKSPEEREAAIQELRQAFVARRLAVGIRTESLREKLLSVLEQRLSDLSPNVILRAIEILNATTKEDYAIEKGIVPNKQSINIHNVLGVKSSISKISEVLPADRAGSSQVEKIRRISEILEAMEIIKGEFEKKKEEETLE